MPALLRGVRMCVREKDLGTSAAHGGSEDSKGCKDTGPPSRMNKGSRTTGHDQKVMVTISLSRGLRYKLHGYKHHRQKGIWKIRGATYKEIWTSQTRPSLFSQTPAHWTSTYEASLRFWRWRTDAESWLSGTRKSRVSAVTLQLMYPERRGTQPHSSETLG